MPDSSLKTEANSAHFVSISTVGNNTEMEFQTIDNQQNLMIEETKDELYEDDDHDTQHASVMCGPDEVNPALILSTDSGDVVVTCQSNLC